MKNVYLIVLTHLLFCNFLSQKSVLLIRDKIEKTNQLC